MHFEDIVFIGERIAELGLGNAAIGGSEELIPKYDKTTQEGIKRLQRLIRRESTRALPYTQDIDISEKQFEDIIIELKDKALARGLNGKEFFDEDGDDTYYKFFKKTITDRFPPPAPVPVPTMPVPNTAPVPPAMPAQLPMGPIAPSDDAGPGPMPMMAQSTEVIPRNWRPTPGVLQEFKNGASFSKLRTRVIDGVGEFIKKYYEDKVFTARNISDTSMSAEIRQYGNNYNDWVDIQKVIEDAYPESIIDGLPNRTYGRKDGKMQYELFSPSLDTLLKKGILKRYKNNLFYFYSVEDLESGTPRYESYGPVYYVNSPEGKAAMSKLLEEQAKLEEIYYSNYLANGGKKQNQRLLKYPPISD